MCEMSRDALKALVEQAREDEAFPGFFLAADLGLSDEAYKWVDADGFPHSRADLVSECEAELDYLGAAWGGGDSLGADMSTFDPAGFDMSVSMYIGRLEAQGVLIPVRHGDGEA